MRPVNLLPEASRRHRPSGRLGGSAYAVVGALAVVLLMAVAYVLTANQISSRQSEIARAQQEIEEARQRAGSFAAFGNFAAIKEARVASVRDLASVRFDWERLMREVAHVTPNDIWLNEMTASMAPQDASGGAAPAAATADPAAPLSPSLALSGCAKGQSAVAAMMVRLRKLHRAEDVALTESAREEDTSGGATAGDSAASSSGGCSGGRFKFDVTVTFSAPAPGQEPDAGRVPAALGGGA